MPDKQQGRREWEIALWGPTRAGKTALLAQLYHRSVETGWRVRPAPESMPFVRTTGDYLASNRFPLPTAVNTRATVVYRLERRDGLSFVLRMEDRPGTEWESPFGTDTPAGSGTGGDGEQQGARPARQLLASADGLVLLLHPTLDTATLERQVRETFLAVYVARSSWGPRGGDQPGDEESRRDQFRDERPVAVCLSKSDSLVRTPEDLRFLVIDPEAFVLKETSPSLEKWVRDYCSNFKFFAISSVGVRLRFGVVEPLVVLDETLSPRISSLGRPINLMVPFEWIISRLEAAP